MSNRIEIGRIAELFRYPIKSMAGIAIESSFLGWHGLGGDRRFAFRRVDEQGGFPWLTASRLSALLRYQPLGHDNNIEEPLPTHVRTPSGAEVPLYSEELRQEVAQQFGSGVELMRLNHGIFDEAAVSVISTCTLRGLARELGYELDQRRFRPNIVLETNQKETFCEDEWVGGTIIFGDEEYGAAVSITLRDLRCVMVNFDPDTANNDSLVLKAVGRLNKGNAGVYGTVVRTGILNVGQTVWLTRN
ncbi:MAG: MOSC domain-containing protein [Blastocatellia bacterium]|nr:MOSC domain-containing protein [Blastocatellia bacterium]